MDTSLVTIDTRPRIVVGVDASGASVAALREAGRLARALWLPLVALHVWPCPADCGMFAPVDCSHDAESRQTLAGALERAFGFPEPAGVELAIAEGPVAAALIDASRGATMLVVGDSRHRGIARMIRASVSATCAAHARCPVLVHHFDSVVPMRVPRRKWSRLGDVSVR